MPATSRIPKPRTIGTGENASTAKPAAVAAAAIATAGAPSSAARRAAAATPSRTPSPCSPAMRACSWIA